MTPLTAERIKQIKDFEALIELLRDELDWPLKADDIDDLSFDYDPEEIGLTEDVAVKVNYIKQLRPLAHNQPWGIFYIDFEPKKLPVVVLRRILQKLVIKKRVTAKTGDHGMWHMNDLLFINSFGVEEEREMTFAHFSDNHDTALPTLKVIGWDTQDTPLHLDQCAKELGKLRFDPEITPDQWREQWRSAFSLEHREVITTSKSLAEHMAILATKIRKRVNTILKLESENGPVRKLHKAFQETLIHDLTDDDFSDMYAQTITYGLFSARCSRESDFIAENLTDMIPVTNPFLKELLGTFLAIGGRKDKIDFDELGINDVVQMLRDANMEAVKRDFDDKNPEHDPVIHFYELFLKQYDAKKKMQRGVFYTPKPVVSFIVRSIHETLQKDFGLEYGLADTATWGDMIQRNSSLTLPTIKAKKPNSPDWVDVPIDPNMPFVQILDPACGTGTFLVEVIDIIDKTMKAKWRKEGQMEFDIPHLWNEYVADNLLPRLYGFELMMAPYAIAHMKIGLKLFATGYRFQSSQRSRIYMTNSLEPPRDFSDRLAFDAPALAHEAQAVNAVKRCQRFTVVLGNPPYSKSSRNQNPWIETIMEGYKHTVRANETQIQALSDDYSKFLRLAHYVLEESQVGLFGFITNNGFLDGPLFRDMRESMLLFFNAIRIMNLHGDSRKKLSPPSGKSDENVFDIQQGVAISLMSKNQQAPSRNKINYRDIWGTRQERYKILYDDQPLNNKSVQLEPKPIYYLFIPVSIETESEFQNGWHLYNVFGTGNNEADNHIAYGAGFVTQQDKFAIGFSESEIVRNIDIFLDSKISDEELWSKFKFCSTNQWDFKRAKDELKKIDTANLVRRCLYRPFDFRYTVFDRNVCTITRKRITSQFDNDNIALLTTRRVTRLPFNNIFIADHHAEYKVASHDRNTIVFPLWIYSNDEGDATQIFNNEPELNFNKKFLTKLADKLNLPQEPMNGCPNGFSPEDIFGYIYAVFHSPTYRQRYAEFLKIDFPRVPITSDIDMFRKLVKLGDDLMALHLMESDKLEKSITTFPVEGDNAVTKVGETGKQLAEVKDGKGKLYVNKQQYFDKLPEEVWNFHIGGYQVCHKWLKDRNGRKLTTEDITHYHKIVVALAETIKCMAQIDETINAHTGWPIK